MTVKQAITVELEIDNVYPDGSITTYVTASVPGLRSGEPLDEWAAEHLLPLTGTGRTKGDASYFVTIINSSEPSLVDEEFEF